MGIPYFNENGEMLFRDFHTFFEEGESQMKLSLAALDYDTTLVGATCSTPTHRGIAYHFYRRSYGSSTLPKWAPDTDGDSIADTVDLNPTASTSDFSDGKDTAGSITALGDQTLVVADAPDSALGVVITSSYKSETQSATVTMSGLSCDPDTVLTINAGTEVIVTCGSVTVDVVRGTVEIVFAATDGTLATTSLAEGNSVTFEPETATFTAPPENLDPVVITIDGKEISVSPGETVNVPPDITSVTGPLEPFRTETLVETSALFADPGTSDTHTASWDWGDGTITAGIVNSAAGLTTGSHTYATPGVYTVAVTVTDDQGGTDTGLFEFLVAYDPDAGFVTGGGWFDSPPGALATDPEASGKANFGYVAKYKKGKSTPDGQTAFQFQAGDLDFHSTSYDWLVLTGADTAKFKGTGTINGEGEYKFQIWTYDDPDEIRVKIWSEDETGTETIIYDTGEAVPLGGGGITVHDGE